MPRPLSIPHDKFQLPNAHIDDVLAHYCSFPQNFNLASWDADADAAVTTIAPPPFGRQAKKYKNCYKKFLNIVPPRKTTF